MRRGPFCFSARRCRVRHNVGMATAVLVKALGAFFAIMNPFVNLPLFLSLTQEQDAATQRRTAVRTTISSTVMCAVVLLLGATILRFFGIGVDDFRVAGGIVLLIISLSMLNGSGSSAHEGSRQEKGQRNVVAGSGNDVAFYPMTFPILVGPGNDRNDHRHSVPGPGAGRACGGRSCPGGRSCGARDRSLLLSQHRCSPVHDDAHHHDPPHGHDPGLDRGADDRRRDPAPLPRAGSLRHAPRVGFSKELAHRAL